MRCIRKLHSIDMDILRALSWFVLMSCAYYNTVAETEAVYNYLGCYRDRGRPNRVLETKAFTSGDTTLEQCMLSCLGRNYEKMGLENGNECHCGNPENYAIHGSCPEAGCACDHPCGGDRDDICGGDWALSIYNISYIELTTTVEVQSTTADSEVISASTTSHQPDLVTYATPSSTEKNSTEKQISNTQQTSIVKKKNTGAYIGGAISGVVIIILPICAAVFLTKRGQTTKGKSSSVKFENDTVYCNLAAPGTLSTGGAKPRLHNPFNSPAVDHPQQQRVSELYSNNNIAYNKAAVKSQSQPVVTLMTNDMYDDTRPEVMMMTNDLYHRKLNPLLIEEGEMYSAVNLSYDEGGVYYEAEPVKSDNNVIYNNI